MCQYASLSYLSTYVLSFLFTFIPNLNNESNIGEHIVSGFKVSLKIISKPEK